ncbi:LbetaH domain-containing protein [Herbiconiux daphne]|uniref:Uncharacterized protein n=1 Tax=Herbiconiux daphne TaxID=2970914 RepID=A0ABT2GZR6_9MICO|nr:hypothetical protein [Herbiconiux daphne]MCS5733463.1 hypothetical protein [Herbiconiux daphne]
MLRRIRNGLIYSETEAAFQAPQRRADLIFDYNHTPSGRAERRRETSPSPSATA